ncbi:uncharacterized protein [Panulirus ornatus]|uniref:uncharacterized protein n=1 Tax=Panulirus ornatus TaxID=150431 RepID=UPI003A8B5355
MDVKCPICDTSFSSSEIEMHAEECIQARFGNENENTAHGQKSDSKRKHSALLEENCVNEANIPSCSSKLTSPSSSKKSRTEEVHAWSFLRYSSQSTSPRKRKEQKDKLTSTQRALQDLGAPPVEENAHAFASQESVQYSGNSNGRPLADKMRPRSFDDYIGQESLLNSNSFLRTLIMQENFISMILWGPPGCGKTTLANIIHERCRGSDKWRYASLSACVTGVQDVKTVVIEAQGALQLRKKRTVLFMDEVHRFNKTQQDVFLPHVESGLLTLVGATTENPSFALNSSLLSRCRVITLNALSPNNIKKILRKALQKLKIAVHREEQVMGIGVNTKQEDLDSEEECIVEYEETASDPQRMMKISQEAVHWLSEMSGGDARCALSTLQILLESHHSGVITLSDAKEALQEKPKYQRQATLQQWLIKFVNNTAKAPSSIENPLPCTSSATDVQVSALHGDPDDPAYSEDPADPKKNERIRKRLYLSNFASALQKSIRGGDDNAALYWTMRMIKGGEDPRFIARRLVRTAAEDIGLGTPEALTYAVSAMQAVQMLGMPESDVILAQCAVYLARAQHNPEVYLAMTRVSQHIQNHAGQLPPVPLHLRNASSKLMKDLGYGRGYSHAPGDVKNIEYMPEALKNINFFRS